MLPYQKEFIEFALSVNALKFGEFMTKSGRKSPYFFNSGAFKTGSQIAKLGDAYASAIKNSLIKFDVLFGPAYKGIPLATATAVSLAVKFGLDVPFSFNRKEAKDHGEKGTVIGAELKGKILVIDDVITAGTSVRESAEIIRAAGAELAGVVISLDRQEKGRGEKSAIQEVQEEFKIQVISIIRLEQILEFLSENKKLGVEFLEKVRVYRTQYGV